MKFLSVCVLYIYVRVACSFYLESSGSSTNPNDSPNEYSMPNFQNTYYSNNANVRTTEPNVNVQNGYYYPSTQKNIGGQPSTNLPNKVGSVPIPHQIPQTSSGIQQTKPVNPPANTPGQSSQASMIQHIIKNPYIKEMYTKNLPPKRYTIIHPDGRIEYTDEISGVTSKYSDYVMLKATDILANVRQSNEYDNTQRNIQNAQPNTWSSPITTSNENKYWTSGNSYQNQYNTGYPKNDLGIPGAPYQNNNYQSTLNPNDQQSITNANKNYVNSNPAGITDGLQIPTNADVKENIPNDGAIKNSAIETSPNNVVARSPLPIYPETVQFNAPVNNDIPAENNPELSKSAKVEGLSAGATNVSDIINTSEKQTLSINESPSTDSTVPIPNEVEQLEILPVILPEVEPLSTVPEIQTIPQIEKSQTEIVPTVTTIEEPSISNSTNDSSLDNIKGNEESTDISTKPTDNTNITQDEKKLIVNDTSAPSDSKESLPASKPAVGEPTTWFHLTEDNIWNALRNNTSNIYFLFLPPRPKVIKKIRTTIFPNGTSIEEITESVADYTEDAKPDLKKNKTIVLN